MAISCLLPHICVSLLCHFMLFSIHVHLLTGSVLSPVGWKKCNCRHWLLILEGRGEMMTRGSLNVANQGISRSRERCTVLCYFFKQHTPVQRAGLGWNTRAALQLWPLWFLCVGPGCRDLSLQGLPGFHWELYPNTSLSFLSSSETSKFFHYILFKSHFTEE
jgi:hypothetical protein